MPAEPLSSPDCRLCSLSVGQWGTEESLEGHTPGRLLSLKRLYRTDKACTNRRNEHPIHMNFLLYFALIYSKGLVCVNKCVSYVYLLFMLRGPKLAFENPLPIQKNSDPSHYTHASMTESYKYLHLSTSSSLMHNNVFFCTFLLHPHTHIYANITFFHKMKSSICTCYTKCLLLLKPKDF